MDPVRNVLEELRADPRRFQRTDGYRRLLELLEDRNSPLAAKELLRGKAPFIGDLLWTVCELDDLDPYVEEAALHIDDPDRGTAAYAFEILIRAAHESVFLEAALSRLESAPLPVREHAILVLSAQGLSRAKEVFFLGKWVWAAALMAQLLDGCPEPEMLVKTLVDDPRPERVIVGLMIATLVSESSESAIRILDLSESDWVRDFGQQLRRMFENRWRPTERKNDDVPH